MDAIRKHRVSPGSIALWFLGQNSFILKDAKGFVYAVDPYLSDYCATRGKGSSRTQKSRMLPVFIEPEDLMVDCVLLTHSHCDHTDPETIARLHDRDAMLFMAPHDAAMVLRSIGIREGNIVRMHSGERYSYGALKITATFALPTDSSDLNHIGYLIEAEGGKKLYISGDTAQCGLLSYLREESIDAAIVCINAGYGNLSHWQAAELMKEIGARMAIPCHYDMFPHNSVSPAQFKQSLATLAPDIVYHEMAYEEPLAL
jgi:L-ascorbate 6-phosphate lactonase